MISINDLYKQFGKNKVLKGIDLKIESPGIVAILGPNGSGKTTLIKSLLGMVIPDKGSILVQDTSIKGKAKYRNQIDYLPQIANFPNNLTVMELIMMIKDLRGDKSADHESLISRFGIETFLNKKLVNLSGGTKQKVNLVLTFMFDRPLIILDEPTSGLDPIALISLKELLAQEKAKGKIILITSHIMSFVDEIADSIVFLLEGKIYFSGSIEELKMRTKTEDFENAIATILNEQHA